MDYNFTPEQEEFRKGFQDWLKQALPADYDPKNPPKLTTNEEKKQAYCEFQNKLSKAGYAGMQYPKQYGGGEKSIIEEVIVQQELVTQCAAFMTPGIITHSMAVPVLYHCGTDEQKNEFLPKIFNGTHLWCQGFSEPDAGSDVANISTMATKDGDHYVINGQKAWTSYAHLADYCLLIVRTDPDSRKHKGLTYLLVDMSLPGVDVRPMTMITGHADFNEVFFDNVRVPTSMIVGQEGDGWKISITTLMFERVMGDITMASLFEFQTNRILEMSKSLKRSGVPVSEDPVFRQQLSQSYIDILALKYHGLRNLSTQIKGGIPGPEGSIGKLLWSEPTQRISEWAINMMGLNGQVTEGVYAVENGEFQYNYLRSKGFTIEAGTSEIQRNIIGERVLGLPKDASRHK